MKIEYLHCTEYWAGGDKAFTGRMTSELATHEKLARLSSDVRGHVSMLDVVPNLTAALNHVIDDMLEDSCSDWPFLYHVMFGAGFPPTELQLNWTTVFSKRFEAPEGTTSETIGWPGSTAQNRQYYIYIIYPSQSTWKQILRLLQDPVHNSTKLNSTQLQFSSVNVQHSLIISCMRPIDQYMQRDRERDG